MMYKSLHTNDIATQKAGVNSCAAENLFKMYNREEMV